MAIDVKYFGVMLQVRVEGDAGAGDHLVEGAELYGYGLA